MPPCFQFAAYLRILSPARDQGAVFPRGNLSRFRFRTLGFNSLSGSAGKNRKPPSTTHFPATKPQVAGAQIRGLVGIPRFFIALPESLVGSMRQILEPSSTPPFSPKETAGRDVATFRCARHVLNLPHTSEFRPCCRLHSTNKSVR